MSILSTVERKALFSLTRILALLVTLGLAVGVAFGIYVATIGTTKIPTGTAKADQVFRADTIQTASTDEPNPAADKDPLKGLQVPAVPMLKRWLDAPEIRPLIERQVRTVERKNRQVFLDELGQVVMRAEKEQMNPGSAAQTFFQVWDTAQAQRKLAETAHKAEQEKAVYGIAVGLSLIALFSLVLVLLAIERNTRPSGLTA